MVFRSCAGDHDFSSLSKLVERYPQLRDVERVNLELRPRGAGVWAFVSITSNETQHVTVVTPH